MITEIQSCFDGFVTFHDFINSFTLYNGFVHTNVTLAFSARPLRTQKSSIRRGVGVSQGKSLVHG